ncbi:hypothetical protein Tco_0948802 [Tanacetum coccineum]
MVTETQWNSLKLDVESYQRKLNLLKPQRTCLGITSKELYTPNYDPRGVIYEDKQKQKRLMRLDELYKFSDGTLQSVHKTLHTRLQNLYLGFNPKYDMPNRAWSMKDQERTKTILKKIDVVLLKRRIMRSLKVLVGGRKTEMDKRLLKRTNWRDLPRDIPLDRIEVLWYDTKGVKVMGIMLTKTELTLEQTQQGVSDEVLVSIEGVEE